MGLGFGVWGVRFGVWGSRSIPHSVLQLLVVREGPVPALMRDHPAPIVALRVEGVGVEGDGVGV